MAVERMSWQEIKEKYPDQWVGLEDVEFKPNNRSSIMSAVVKYTDKSKKELTRIQFDTDGKVMGVYTTPDHLLQTGVVGYFG